MNLCKIASLVVLSLAAFVADAVVAKCATSQIEVFAPDSKNAIVIDDPDVIQRFHVWNGPRVLRNNKPARGLEPGAFIDWVTGAVPPPEGAAASFRVSFYCRFDEAQVAKKLYEVDYLLADDESGGYVYLPGRGEDGYILNTSTIIHSAEGNWFRSTPAWERYVRPLIQREALGERSAPVSR